MIPKVPVMIRWLGEWAKKPPEGKRWSAPAFFDHQPKPWPPKESWSVILFAEGPSSETNGTQKGYAQFLVDEAPHEWLLQYGFTLYYGKEQCAHVTPRT